MMSPYKVSLFFSRKPAGPCKYEKACTQLNVEEQSSRKRKVFGALCRESGSPRVS